MPSTRTYLHNQLIASQFINPSIQYHQTLKRGVTKFVNREQARVPESGFRPVARVLPEDGQRRRGIRANPEAAQALLEARIDHLRR